MSDLQDVVKTAAMCLPCEVARLPGRIQNKSWGWNDVPACAMARANPVTHNAALIAILGVVALATGNPIAIGVVAVLAVIKIRNYAKKD